MVAQFLTRFVLAVIAILLTDPVCADDKPSSNEANKTTDERQTEAGPQEIAQLIKQLDANQFTAREAASQKLTASGQAKNADELKENDPEAFKLYEEYSKLQPGLRLFSGQLPLGRIPVPAGPELPRPFVPFGIARDVSDQLDRAQKQLDEATKVIKKHLDNMDNADDLGKALEQLEDAKKQLDDARSKLRG